MVSGASSARWSIGAAPRLPGVPPAASGSEAGPRPVLLLLCGGGGGQCRPGFEPFLQYLIHQLGVVIVAPNVRGSTGFGRGLAEAGQGALRDDAVRDIGSLLVWIDLQRDLDRNRVALLGEGYGAYLALQSLADYGDRLRGGIAAFPPQLAALANRTAIRRPLLLVQGLNNPAAPAYEMEQLRSRLRVDGVDVQYLAAADEARALRANQISTPIARRPPVSSRSYCADRMVTRRGSVRSGGVWRE
jgi:dipeptidyl aminopeptidase/acylaminoacyl peptidase